MNEPNVSKRKGSDRAPRRRLSFTVRSLLGLTTILAILMAVWTAYIRPYRIQHVAIESPQLSSIRSFDRFDTADGPEWHRMLVTSVVGNDAYRQLTHAGFIGQRFDERALERIAELPFLTHLTFDRCELPDTGVDSLQNLVNLESLLMPYCDLSDDEVGSIASMPKLRELRLTGNNVTDDGLQRLSQLPNIEEVFLRWTSVTQDGVTRFHEVHPNCRVFSYVSE